MVFFFECCDPQYVIYMGKDKYENEELLKFGYPEDVCKESLFQQNCFLDLVSR